MYFTKSTQSWIFSFLVLAAGSMPLSAGPVNLLQSWHNAPPSNPKKDKSYVMENSENTQSEDLPIEEDTVEEMSIEELSPSTDDAEETAVMQAQKLVVAEESPAEATNPVVIIDSVEVGKIESVPDENVGLLDEGSGGLPQNIWQGTPVKEIVTQLSQLPDHYQNHAFYQLALRLLLSAFEFPQGTDEYDLTSIRAKKLWTMGHAEEAYQVINYDKKNKNPDLRNQILYEKLLSEGDLDGATKLADSCFANEPSTYWEKAVIFCQIQNNNNEQARLSLSLFEESNPEGQPFFIEVVKSILEKTKYQTSSFPIEQMSLQDLLLLAAAKGTLTKEDLNQIKPAYIPIVLQQAEKLNIIYEDQLNLWERLCDFAPKYIDDLRKIYREIPADQLALIKEELKNVDQNKAILLTDSPLVRACLFQVFEGAVIPSSQLTMAQELMNNGIHNNKIGVITGLLAPTISKTAPSKEKISWGPIAITALSLSPYKKEAKYWCPYVQEVSNAAYLPFVLNICGTKQENLVKALEHLEKESNRESHLAYTYLVLEGMGISIPPEYWHHIKNDTPLGSIPLAQKMALKNAAKEKRVGETLAYILKIAGDNKAALGPEGIKMILSALRKVGLVREAQTMALWYLAHK